MTDVAEIARLISPSTKARFWSRVDVRAADECWPWQGYKTPKGYGNFTVCIGKSRTALKAHRLAFILDGGTIPDGLCLDHCAGTVLAAIRSILKPSPTEKT